MKEKIDAAGLDRAGRIIGQLEVEGELEPGEVDLPASRELRRVVAEISDEIDDQRIPVEYKDIVRRFYGSLGKGSGAAADGASAGGANGGAASGSAGAGEDD